MNRNTAINLNLYYIIWILFLFTNCTSSEEKQYERFDYSYIPVEIGDKWGYVNTKGDIIINPQFKNARAFADGLAAVQNNEEQWGYIDTTGKYIITPQYESISDFQQGIASVVRYNGRPENINRQGKIIVTHNDAVKIVYAGENRIIYKPIDNELLGIKDTTGKVVVTPQFKDIRKYSEGYAAVKYKVDEDEYKWGYLNFNGDMVIPHQFDYAGDFKDSLALIKSNDKYGYINTKGKIVINPQFDDANSFSEKRAAVSIGELWGFIGKDGKIIINPQFEHVRDFENGLAAVEQSEDKWGYIDKKGKYTINPQFKDASSFYHVNTAVVKSGDKYGLIDSLGKYVANPQFDRSFVSRYGGIWNHGAHDYILSHYIDFEGIVENIFSEDLSALKDFELNRNFSDIKNLYNIKYSDSSIYENRITLNLVGSYELHPFLEIDKVSYFFDRNLKYREKYLHHSDYYYNYYDYRTVENKEAAIKAVMIQINMYFGPPRGRAEEFGKIILEKLIDFHNVEDSEIEKIESTEQDNVLGRSLHTDQFIYTVLWRKDLNQVFISIAEQD